MLPFRTSPDAVVEQAAAVPVASTRGTSLRIHRDALTALLGVVIFAGMIAILLMTLNPVR